MFVDGLSWLDSFEEMQAEVGLVGLLQKQTACMKMYFAEMAVPSNPKKTMFLTPTMFTTFTPQEQS